MTTVMGGGNAHVIGIFHAFREALRTIPTCFVKQNVFAVGTELIRHVANAEYVDDSTGFLSKLFQFLVPFQFQKHFEVNKIMKTIFWNL